MSEPAPYAKTFHAIPQMDLITDSNGSYAFHYNATKRGVLFPYSSPVILVVFPLIVVLTNLLIELCTKRRKKKHPSYFYRLKDALLCLIIFLFVLIVIFERKLHNVEMDTFHVYEVPGIVVNPRNFVMGINDAFENNNFKISLTKDELKLPEMKPYKRVFGKFALEIFAIYSDLQNTSVLDDTMLMCTLYMEKYFNFTWHRYFTLMLCWFFMLVNIAYKPHRSVTVAIFGILYCTVMSTVVLAATTALAEYCQSPAYLSTVSPYNNVTHSEIEVQAVALDACLKYLQRIEKDKDLLRDTYFEWIDPFHQLEMELYYENAKANKTTEDLEQNVRYRYVNGLTKYLNNITKTNPVDKVDLPICLDGRDIKVEDQYLPYQILDGLCIDDRMIKWFVYQLIALFFACLAYITLALMGICDVKYYEEYGFDEQKMEEHKSNLKAKKRCSLPGCERPSRSSVASSTPTSSSTAPQNNTRRMNRQKKNLRFKNETSFHTVPSRQRKRRHRRRRRSLKIIEAGQGEQKSSAYRSIRFRTAQSTHSLTSTVYRRHRQDKQLTNDRRKDIKMELQKLRILSDSAIDDYSDSSHSHDERSRTY